MTLLTRRSLLRVGALSPLIIPGRSFARVGGAPAIVTSPCGSPISIPAGDDGRFITAPGCYQLVQDVAGDFYVGYNPVTFVKTDNVTVLGNGHTVNGTLTVGRGYAGTGIGFDSVGVVVQDIVVGSLGAPAGPIQVNGNNAQALTPLAVHLKNITMYSTSLYAITVSGSNILVENSTFKTSGSNPPPAGTDDTMALSNTRFGTWSYYVTIDNCIFASLSGSGDANFDVGIEGATTWHFVTIKNSTSTQSPYGGFGGWYFGSGDGNCGMTINDCQFFHNTLKNGWRFCNPQNPTDANIGSIVAQVFDDDTANSLWGGAGMNNVFGLPAGPPNIYV